MNNIIVVYIMTRENVCSKKSKYRNDSRYICNPRSGRYVLRTGPTGRKLVRELTKKYRSPPKKGTKDRSNKKEKTVPVVRGLLTKKYRSPPKKGTKDRSNKKEKTVPVVRGLSGTVKDNGRVYSSPPPSMNGVNPNILGLVNNGNTCYFNSALQMFLGTTVVQNTFRNVVVNKRFLKMIEELIHNRINPVVSTYNPRELRRELSKYNPFFGEHGQQDCHECFVNLLYVIHENTLVSLQNHYHHGKILKLSNRLLVIKSNEKMYQDLLVEGCSLINSLYLGQLKSVLSCKECNNMRHNFENINNLSLSLPPSRSINIVDCFMGYFKPELLEENINCPRCNRRTRTEKKLSLWRFPKLLVLHFKRYTQTRYNVYERNNCIVEFGEDLIFEDPITDNTVEYKLKCIVNHYGVTPLSGHYSTIIKHATYGWVNMNDSAYYSVKSNKLVNDSVYMVLYEMV